MASASQTPPSIQGDSDEGNPEQRSFIAYDLLFGRLRLPLPHHIAFVFSPPSLVFLFLVGITLAAFDLTQLRDIIPAWLAVLYWLASVLTYVGLSLVFLTVAALLQKCIPVLPIYLPLVSTLSICSVAALLYWPVLYSSNGAYQFPHPGIAVAFIIGVQPFETFYFRFLIPIYRPSVYETYGLLNMWEPEARSRKPRVLVAGSDQVEIASLLHVESQAHFVAITTRTQQLRHRARLADMLVQLAEVDGIQPHRSWWVSRAAAPILDESGPRPVLRLADGNEVAVAQARLTEVKDWLSAGESE